MFLLLIIALIILALLFVVFPLLRKTQIQSADRQTLNVDATRQQISDIENDVENDLIDSEQLILIRQEAEDTFLMEMVDDTPNSKPAKSKRFNRITAVVLSLFIPVFAFLIYLSVGTPDALLQSTEQFPAQNEQPSLEQLVSKLEQRLSQEPGDEQGWLVLAQTNMMMQRFDEAVNAMEKLYQLSGDTPDVLARYADTLTMANNGRFDEQALRHINKALELDPDHVHALWLSGVQAYQAGEYETAIQRFQKARVNIDDAENLAQIDELIQAASERGNITLSDQVQSDKGTELLVKIDIEDELKDKINPEHTLFIFAKAAQGPPMPLAVSKHKAAELPLSVSLNDAMAMMPELTLSSFDEVIITARISPGDQPLSQSGDFQGNSAVINPSKLSEVSVLIDEIVQ